MQSKLYIKFMKILTLQITADNFETILKGEQKIETRLCDTEALASKYCEHYDDGGWGLKEYDALRLINGRSKPSGENPELTVKVVDCAVEFLVDENGNDLIVEDIKTGNEIAVKRIYYRLGDVIESKNLENFNPNKKTLKKNFVTIEEFEKMFS